MYCTIYIYILCDLKHAPQLGGPLRRWIYDSISLYIHMCIHRIYMYTPTYAYIYIYIAIYRERDMQSLVLQRPAELCCNVYFVLADTHTY